MLECYVNINGVTHEVIAIADRNCRDDKKYMLVSYKEYARLMNEDKFVEITDSGPNYWD